MPGTQNGVPLYRATDYEGTLVGSLLANGNFVDPVDHTPFGQVFVGNTSDPYLFTGKERDTESGLDYFGARYYGSSTGRFFSPDPSGLFYADPTNPQSLNLYAYVQNNPLNNVDANGLDCVYINNDTGAYEGFNRGDCDNSTDAKANTGHYYDGTVTTLYTSTGTLQGQVTALQGTDSSGTNLFTEYRTPGNQSGLTKPVDISTDVLEWGMNRTGKPDGLWTHGNWAGPGGSGIPTDRADSGAMIHDYCYDTNGHLSAHSNFGAYNSALQACNQALCDTESKVAASAMADSDAARTSGNADATYKFQLEAQAAQDMVSYFSNIPFHGNGCKAKGK